MAARMIGGQLDMLLTRQADSLYEICNSNAYQLKVLDDQLDVLRDILQTNSKLLFWTRFGCVFNVVAVTTGMLGVAFTIKFASKAFGHGAKVFSPLVLGLLNSRRNVDPPAYSSVVNAFSIPPSSAAASSETLPPAAAASTPSSSTD